jgi:CRP-like cAMP-binding protein
MDAQELGQIPLFSDLSEEDLRALSTYADEVTVSEGKHLVDEGGYAYDLFVIVEGKAQVIHNGEVVAELEKQQRNATVVAKSRMRLVTLTGWDLRRMRKQLGSVVEKLEQAIQQRS